MGARCRIAIAVLAVLVSWAGLPSATADAVSTTLAEGTAGRSGGGCSAQADILFQYTRAPSSVDFRAESSCGTNSVHTQNPVPGFSPCEDREDGTVECDFRERRGTIPDRLWHIELGPSGSLDASVTEEGSTTSITYDGQLDREDV